MSTPDKRRILFILPNLMPGGAERVIITLMNGLDRERFTPALLVIYGEGPLKEIIDKNIPVHKLNHRGNILFSMPRLMRFLRQQKAGIIISTMAPLNFTVLLLKPFLGKTRIIVREAITPSYLLQSHRFLAPFVRLLYRNLYALADIVISPSKQILHEFSHDLHMNMKNHAWLPNPVDVDELRHHGTVARNKEQLHFICSGRLHVQKGYDRLIPALKNFNSKHHWNLTILGEGPEHAALETLIKINGMEDNVSLAGYIQNPWAYYASADFFILPSRWEGLPNVVLESLACGTPVIALREAGGILDIASHAQGAVTVVSDIKELIAVMENTSPDPANRPRASLLPPIFEKESIQVEFSNILNRR